MDFLVSFIYLDDAYIIKNVYDPTESILRYLNYYYCLNEKNIHLIL